MKLKLSVILSFFLLEALLALPQTPPIGSWRDHLPYHQAIGVLSTDKKIWCATPYSLFSVDLSDNSIDRLSKTNGLSGTGISAIGYDQQSGRLVVAYNSSDIDLIAGTSVINIPDLRQTSLPVDKTIHAIYILNGLIYLSCGFGIVVLDEDKNEVKDSYIIGNAGDTTAVFSLAADANYFYAATSEGLKEAALGSPDLADYHNWTLLSDNGGTTSFRQVMTLNGQVLVLKDDSVLQWNNNNLGLFYTDGWRVNNISVSENNLLICEQKADTGRVLILSATGTIEKILQQTGSLSNPRQAVLQEGEPWVADGIKGLSVWAGTTPETVIPNSPLGLALGDMAIRQGTGLAGPAYAGALWVAAGGVDSNWTPLNDHNGLYRLETAGWTNYNASGYPVFDSVSDLVTLALDPRDSSTWAGSFGEGLLQWKPGDVFTHYAANSPLGDALDAPGSYRVGGLAFDADGTLWIANYGAEKELVKKNTTGSWVSFTIPFVHTGNAVSQVLPDDYKQIWIVSPKGNGVFCYNPGPLPDDPSDDQWKYYQAGAGNGNLPDNNVNCLAKDKNGFIWIGTANGIGLIQCAQNVFKTGSCSVVWPIVQFDNFAGYLFSNQNVQAIAVDGADRKWIGTNNGVWLISPDAQQIIYHFTTDSTPLLNNDVRKITIDPQTGEVFFATAGGLCSFRSTATEGGSANSNVLVFPNPVPPGYNGTIAIRGLVDGAVVKITSLDGRLVYQGNAMGGQLVWDGRDYKGRAVLAGVYLVLASDISRSEKIVTKIVMVK